VAADVTGEPADVVKPDASPVEQPPADRPVLSRPPLGARAHRGRFFVIYGILGLALAAGIVGIVVYAGRSINPGPAWSSWKPSGGGLGAAKQIAEHVSPGYRLPDGNQLVDVIAKGPAVSSGGQTIPIPFIALRGPKGKVDQIQQVSNSDTFTFSLCGLGQACSIATGKPSVARATLVRREILELALYTFKYVHGVKHVVAFMPPPAGTQPAYVVYLQKSDVTSQLKAPLTHTLAPKVPLPAKITPGEQQRIDGITQPRIYKFGLSQTQQGDAVLVLAPLQA
jgi:hypothetical protein